jgi:glycogen debranching enzyme
MTELVNLSETTIVKQGNTFCVALRDGRLPPATDHPLGLYLDDCRFLRGYDLQLGGQPLRLLTSSDTASTAAVYEFTNPDLVLPGGRELELQSLGVRLLRRVSSGGMSDQIVLRSYLRDRVQLELEVKLDADFRPMFEVRGIVPPASRAV